MVSSLRLEALLLEGGTICAMLFQRRLGVTTLPAPTKNGSRVEAVIRLVFKPTF